MIYTVTFNPSLDYVISLDALTPGEINRTRTEHVYPGGKGINVAVLLSNLGHKSTALGFEAGLTGRTLQDMMDQFGGCSTDFIHLQEGSTRINVKINAGEETEINGQGPFIPDEAVGSLYEKLDRLKSGDYLVLAGSIPACLPEDIYERILARLEGRGIHFIVDATKDLLLNVLKYHPFLIKPNQHELGDMFGTVLKDREDIIAHARMLQEKGARHVLVSMAGDGAILVTEDGTILQEKPAAGTVKNSVGAGDSMVAGFLAGYLNTGSFEKAFRLGLAAGSATAFTYWLADKESIVALLTESAESYGL